jgi:hypothetical protein
MQIAVLWPGAAGRWDAQMSQPFAVVRCRLAASVRPGRMAAAASVLCQLTVLGSGPLTRAGRGRAGRGLPANQQLSHHEREHLSKSDSRATDISGP